MFSSFIPSPPNLEVVSIKVGQGYLAICVLLSPLVLMSLHFLTDISSSLSKIIIVGDNNVFDIDCIVNPNGHFNFM